MPASNSAIRATLRLSSPAWLAQPKNTSSTWDQSRLGCFAISALIGVGGQIVGAHLGERAAETADRGPDGIANEYITHRISP